MEDILASIRRIIADDQSQGTRPGYGNGSRRSNGGQASTIEAETNGARGRTAYDDVLDLARLAPAAVPDQSLKPVVAERRIAPTEPAPVDSPVAAEAPVDRPTWDAEPEHGADMPADTTSNVGARMPEPTRAADDGHDEGTDLVAYEEDPLDDALMSEPLGASVMSAFETLAATVVLQNTPMLEGVMRDLLRPLLKTWLDDNLPALVERLVRTEIERVARGSRG